MKLRELGRFLNEKLSMGGFPAVADSLSSFLADYGVVIRGVEWNVALGKSKYVRLSISYDRLSRAIDTRIVPAPYADAESPVFTGAKNPLWGARSLSEILYVLDPDLEFQPGRTGSFSRTREEIMRQLRLIEKYCRPMLEGDFSAWPAIVGRFEVLRGPSEGETLEMWTLRMREMLHDALRRSRPFLVDMVCWNLRRLGVELTREEQAAWQWAKRES